MIINWAFSRMGEFNPRISLSKARQSDIGLFRLKPAYLACLLAVSLVTAPLYAHATTAATTTNSSKTEASFAKSNNLDPTFANTSTFNSSRSNPLRLTAASLTKQSQGNDRPLLAAVAFQNDTAAQSQEAEAQEAASQDGTPSEDEPVTEGDVEPTNATTSEPVTKAVPSDAVPPYTDELRTPESSPLFNLSQTVSWIIFTLVLIFAAMLIGWFIRRLVSNSLAVDEAASGDLFQATDDQSYSFDEEDRSVHHLHEQYDEHRESNESTEEAEIEFISNETSSPDDEAFFDDPPVSSQKRGFMSRLFGGGNKNDQDGEKSIFESSDHASDLDDIIDVEPEPIDTAPEREETVEDQEEMFEDTAEEDNGNAPFQTVPMPQEPLHAVTPQEGHPGAHVENMPSEFRETLENLEVRQSETTQSINTLEQKLVSYQEGMQNELTSIRNDTTSHQTHLDETMETRFAAISNSVETGIARTEQLAQENTVQADHMNTGELTDKLLNLDKMVKDQSRLTDGNFNRILQKLDALSSPAPQLSRLANDTSELKTQIASLQSFTKETASTPIPAVNEEETKAREQNMQLLRNMETALNEQNRSLRAFREENRVLVRKFDTLNDRIDRMENEMQNQGSTLVDVIEKYNRVPEQETLEPQPTQHRADALGIIGDIASPNSYATPEKPHAYENGHAQHEIEHHNTSLATDIPVAPIVEDVVEETEPEVTPILVSLNPAEHTPAPQESTLLPLSPAAAPQSQITKAEIEEEDERTIRPLTFNFSSGDKAKTNR